MSAFRVSKIQNGKGEEIEQISFDTEDQANEYAMKTSMLDEGHFYAVEKQIDDEDYDDVRHYVKGQARTVF